MKDELSLIQQEMVSLKEQHLLIQERLDTLSDRLRCIEESIPENARLTMDAATSTPEIIPESVEPVLSREGSLPEREGIQPDEKALNLEARIGGIWLNRIGVVAFLLGTAFFLKLAFDQGWINEMTRIIIGAGAALLLLGSGERTRRRGYRGYSQGLTGGGIALLYFTIYAAFLFYGIIHPAAALILMILVTGSGVALSVYQDAPAVATLGILTGFTTPFLFATPEPPFLLLFGYLLLLNLGITGVSYFKRWIFLGLTAFVITNLTLLIVTLFRRFEMPVPGIGSPVYQVFLTLFLLLFSALPFILYTAHRRRFAGTGVFLLIFSGAVYYGLSWVNLHPFYPGYMGLFTLALAASYLAAGLILKHWLKEDLGAPFTALSLAAALLVIFVPVQLRHAWITLGWIVQAAVLCFLGLRLKDARIRFAFWIVLSISLLRLFAVEWSLYVSPENYRFLINRPALLTFFFIATLIFCALAYLRFKPERTNPLQESILLGGLACLLLLIFVSMDLSRYIHVLAYQTGNYAYYNNLRTMAISIFWGCYAAALMGAGFIRKQPLWRYAAIGLFSLTVVKVFLIDLSSLDMLYRFISLIGLGLILLVVSYLYQRYRSRIAPADSAKEL